MAKQKTNTQIRKEKTERIMDLVDERAGYYRANPHRFVEEYLGIHLKLFQKILLWAMMFNDAFYFIAARGLGKTWLVGLFAVVRCILYPGTKIVACSYTFKQGKEIILKITDDFMQKSPLLRSEISSWSTGQNDCYVKFKNGSWIRVYVASENSRGARSNILIIDESRMISQKIVDTVFKPMNASPRQPGYLRKPEYAHLQEMNKEMYMSSAYYAQSEMFEKVKAYCANMLDPKYKYFVCDLPYQLSVQSGLLMMEQLENEVSEATFSEITFQMEREGIFYGSSEDSLFDFKTLNDRRILSESIHDLDFYTVNNIKMPDKKDDEVRVLAVDVALLASKKHDNDASAISIHCGIPTPSNNYIDNINYIETKEGLMTDELGLLVMRYFYKYDCDYIGLDANGIGQAILDFLMSDRFDPLYNETYGALDCINNDELSERCKVYGAPKVIFAIKANAKFNSEACLSLRSGLQNGTVNLLKNEAEAEEILSKIKGWSKMSDTQRNNLRMPYLHTTLLIDELINLTHEINGGLVKVKEKYGRRKDRYSSIEYGFYVLQELGKDLKPSSTNNEDLLSMLTMRKGTRYRSI